MEDVKWCLQHGYPLPCDKCGMPSKTLEELIDDRIDFLRSLTGLYETSYDKELRRGIQELEWVRRMMKDARTQV